MSQLIEVENLVKYFGSTLIVENINLSISEGEILALIGASGGGKSTIIRCINALENFQSGDIRFQGKSISDTDFNLTDYRRQVGMIFQQFNLFDHLTVMGNCNIGQLQVLGRNKMDATAKSLSVLEQVGMREFANVDVRTLSGGQKQRVAIARSLAMDPKVLLLDEPTSSLDPQMVEEVLNVIKKLACNTGLAMVIVSHEMQFTRSIADYMVFLKDGHICEEGVTESFFGNPQTEELRQFLVKTAHPF